MKRSLWLIPALLTLAPPALAKEPPPVEDTIKALDQELESIWRDAKVKPAEEAEDEAFFRRLSLDVTGRVPHEDVARALAKRRSRKGLHQELIDAVLHSEGYARFMAVRWANLLVGRTRVAQAGERPPLLRWLEQRIMGNVRWDLVAQELISAKGKVEENGATQYLLAYRNKPEEMAGNVMRVFQAQQVQCAQCHDHPYKDNWKQKDFWGVAAFFARARPRRVEEKDQLVEAMKGEVRIPGTPGKPGPQVEPRFITGESIDPGEGDYRREELARILTSKNNPYFVRATVNRVWSFFMGRGFTDVNDLAAPEHEELLKILEADFRASGYDLRRLVRVIVSSKAYRLESGGKEKTKDAQLEVWARAPLRPLNLEQMWWSTLEATGLSDRFAEVADEEKRRNAKRNLKRRFFSVFLNHEDAALSEYNTTQALMLLNGPTTNDALWLKPDNPVFKQLLDLKAVEAQVESLFLRVLGRPPAKAEARALRRFSKGADRVQFLQDLWWALLNSSEFLYNH
ncbi:MAG TPA: hypothetical protein DEA08_33185 [Planctomycetes bacterium]|nr:hypothetical protein [Planctomycetota bacterium]